MSRVADQLRPIGPGAGAANPAAGDSPCPAFDSDPIGWCAWVDDALVAGRPLDPASQASTWTDARGCEWRLLPSTEGPEVRPSFGSAFILARGLPLISALLLSHQRILVELTWRDGHEVVQVAPGEVACRDLALAMLTGTELPHEAVARVGPDTWERARERWQQLQEAAPQDGHLSSSAPAEAGESHARPSWPVSAR